MEREYQNRWELTDSNGAAEAGILLKIYIILSPQPPFLVLIPSNRWQLRGESACFASIFFVVLNMKLVYIGNTTKKKSDWLNQSPLVVNKKSSPSDCFFVKWELTDSNRRPSACKADALNQLS